MKLNHYIMVGFIFITIAVFLLEIANRISLIDSFDNISTQHSPYTIYNMVLWLIGATFWITGFFLVTMGLLPIFISKPKVQK